MKEKILISFSGGRTSAYMTWWLLNNMKDKFEMIVVFANTGREREETLQFVKMCDDNFYFNTIWVESFVHNKYGKGTTHVVTDFYNAERNGEPFEDVIAKYGIPNQNAPFCTRELKQRPIQSYAKSIGWKKYRTAIGIRSDEPKRLNWDKKHILYFAELFHVTKNDVNIFWSRQPFDLNLKSYEGNCDLCYKKGLRKLMTLVKHNPELAEWWREMESKYENFDPRNTGKVPVRFFRDNMTIDEIIEDSKLPFDISLDETKNITGKQLIMWDNYLDSNNGCTESCEVF